MLGVFTVSKDKLNLILKRVTVLNSSETFLLTMLPLKGWKIKLGELQFIQIN